MSRPVLLTPGPLTTSARVKRAMLRDWGSRDEDFAALTDFIRAEALRIANADNTYSMVPLQGSGTFAIEAMIASMIAPKDGALVLANGAYGRRIADICARLGLRHDVLSMPDDRPVAPEDVAARLKRGPGLAHVIAVHCETTSGLLNPVEAIAGICRTYEKSLLIDSMSGFGALPVDAKRLGFAALAASSNKCLQGVPGIGFAIVKRDMLRRNDHAAPSLALDLAGQDAQFSADGQWRFTPPTHVVAAFAEALRELADEGGPPARLERYSRNCEALVSGMKSHGYEAVLPPEAQAPVIVSFKEPDASWFDFHKFYNALKARGYIIYAGKMRSGGTFRVGVMGDIGLDAIDGFLKAVADADSELRGLRGPHR